MKDIVKILTKPINTHYFVVSLDETDSIVVTVRYVENFAEVERVIAELKKMGCKNVKYYETGL